MQGAAAVSSAESLLTLIEYRDALWPLESTDLRGWAHKLLLLVGSRLSSLLFN